MPGYFYANLLGSQPVVFEEVEGGVASHDLCDAGDFALLVILPSVGTLEDFLVGLLDENAPALCGYFAFLRWDRCV